MVINCYPMLSFARNLNFISYALAHKVPDHELVVLDSHYPRGLVLAHAANPRVPARLRSNTSTEAAIKWLLLPADVRVETGPLEPKFVTCNHWDLDGFIATWCILNPTVALRHCEELIAA